MIGFLAALAVGDLLVRIAGALVTAAEVEALEVETRQRLVAMFKRLYGDLAPMMATHIRIGMKGGESGE